jgi:hypothetical protein
LANYDEETLKQPKQPGGKWHGQAVTAEKWFPFHHCSEFLRLELKKNEPAQLLDQGKKQKIKTFQKKTQSHQSEAY